MIYEKKLSSQRGPELKMCFYVNFPCNARISQIFTTSVKVILVTGTALHQFCRVFRVGRDPQGPSRVIPKSLAHPGIKPQTFGVVTTML